MKLRRALARLVRHTKSTPPRQADSDAAQARELEQLIASGTAANKFPPR